MKDIFKNRIDGLFDDEGADAHDDVSGATGSDVNERLQFDPHGSEDVFSPSDSEIIDTVTGLVHFAARDYDERAGRWAEQEPLALAYEEGMNLYQTELSDAVDSLDVMNQPKQ